MAKDPAAGTRVHTAQNEYAAMPHASNIVYCDGPDSPHAFDIVPLQPRNGSLDAMCPVCQGRGQWNTEIDLVSFRCKRAACDRCNGAGWVETGSDPVGLPDIVMSPQGTPQWTIRYPAPEDAEAVDPEKPGLAQA
ncbi:hypothetical protein QP185_08155 [Sphingomonas aerolata]|uniref:hypothetical protein n=1 Tax=Sphingomonas aerolata TaxID=185951 RepID=UPI002FDF4172